mgnify:CR=1 FL=1
MQLQTVYLQAFEEPSAGDDTARSAAGSSSAVSSSQAHVVDEVAAARDKSRCMMEAATAVYVHLASALLDATERDMALMWRLTEYAPASADSSDGAVAEEGADFFHSKGGHTPEREVGREQGVAGGADAVCGEGNGHAEGERKSDGHVETEGSGGSGGGGGNNDIVIDPYATVRPAAAVSVTAGTLRGALHQQPLPVAPTSTPTAGATPSWSYALLFGNFQVVINTPAHGELHAAAAPTHQARGVGQPHRDDPGWVPEWMNDDVKVWVRAGSMLAARTPEVPPVAAQPMPMHVLLHHVPGGQAHGQGHAHANVPSEAGAGGGGEEEATMMSVEVVIKAPRPGQPYKDVRVTLGAWLWL